MKSLIIKLLLCSHKYGSSEVKRAYKGQE